MRFPTYSVIYYSGSETMRKWLKENGFEFRERHVFNDFHGTAFIVKKPKGKGTTKKIDLLEKEGFHRSSEEWHLQGSMI